MEPVLFWVFAIATVASAGLVIWARSPINAAMSLVAAFFFLAGIYVLLWAHTVAVLQVLVYAGAVMVLFLFVIMLLSLAEAGPRSPATLGRVLGGAAALGIGAVIIYVVLGADFGAPALLDEARTKSFGSIAQLGDVLYNQYLFAFEAVSLLLLAAIVGAVVVAKTRI